MQTDLFNNYPTIRQLTKENAAVIQGLELHFEFISLNKEKELIDEIDQQPWIEDLSRRVQHYGYKYDYKSRRLDNSSFLGDLPSWQIDLAMRIKELGIIDFFPDQAIVNEYFPGQGIASHIDCEPCFGDVIISLSLGSQCVMNFEKFPNSKDKVEVFLDSRTLLVMKGESRYNWYHGISHRKSDLFNGQNFKRNRRVSITFRKVKL